MIVVFTFGINFQSRSLGIRLEKQDIGKFKKIRNSILVIQG